MSGVVQFNSYIHSKYDEEDDGNTIVIRETKSGGGNGSEKLQRQVNVKIKCATINLGCGDLELEHESFKTRWPRQLNLLKEEEAQNLDILCLQELRDFRHHVGASGSSSASASASGDVRPEPQPEDVLHDISKGLNMQTAIYGKLHLTSPAFGQAICFRRDKFFQKQVLQLWLGKNGEITNTPGGNSTLSTKDCKGFSSMILAVELCFINKQRILWMNGILPSFWVICAHIPTDVNVRLECIKSIDRFLSSSSHLNGHDAPYILMGDFNTFPGESDEHLEILYDPQKNRCGVKKFMTLDGTLVNGGTFRSYYH